MLTMTGWVTVTQGRTMPDLKDIDNLMARLAKRIPEMTKQGMKIAAKDISAGMIDSPAMPVRTGRLVNNWQANTNRNPSYNAQARGTRQSAKRSINDQIDGLPADASNIYLQNPTRYGVVAIGRKKNIGRVFKDGQRAQRRTAKKLTKLFDKEIKRALRS